MSYLFRRAALVLALVTLGAPSAFAQAPSSGGHSRIIDEVNFFKKSTVENMTKALEAAEREYSVPVVIEVVETLRGRAIEDAALDAARLSGGGGLFVYIVQKEKKIHLLTRRQFDQRLPLEKRELIRAAFQEGFKSGSMDEGLEKGVAEIMAILKESASKGPPLVVRDRIGLTLAGAKKAIAAAESKAAEMNIKANIAVVDEGGHMLAFVRMDGARPASAATAQTKATSAATMRQATGPMPAGSSTPDVIVSLALPGAASASGAKITTLFGGVPIVVDGQVIGAVGVGGGTGEQDAEIAKAGAAAIAGESREKTASK